MSAFDAIIFNSSLLSFANENAKHITHDMREYKQQQQQQIKHDSNEKQQQ